MTAEASQATPAPSFQDSSNSPTIPQDSTTEKAEETGRSIFRKFSISLGGRKNSTKSLEVSEGKTESVLGSISSSSSAPTDAGNDAPPDEKRKPLSEGSAKQSKNAAEPEVYLKSGDYQEGDSSAVLDFETAAATSTPIGPNSVADDSRDSASGGDVIQNEAKGARRKSSTTSTASSGKNSRDKTTAPLGDHVNNNENKTSDDGDDPKNGRHNEQSDSAENNALSVGKSAANSNTNNNNNTTDVRKDSTTFSGAPRGKRTGRKLSDLKAVQKKGETLLHRKNNSRGRFKGGPTRSQEQRVGLTSEEERETDTFRETFDDIHETSVVDLRAAAFLNRSAPDLNSAGGDSSQFQSYSESRKLNNTAGTLGVARSRFGHSLHDLNGESVASHSQRRSKYRSHDLDDVHVDVAALSGGKSSTRRRVILKKSNLSTRTRHKSSTTVETAAVSLIDASGENVHFSEEQIDRKFERISSGASASERAVSRSSMSLSIAVSVKEIEDITTQTNASGDDGFDSKNAPAASASAAAAKSSNKSMEEDDDDLETTADKENSNRSGNSEERVTSSESIDNERMRAVISPGASVPILDSEGNEVGDIEVGVANSVEEMLSTVNAVTSAVSDSVNTVSRRIGAEEQNANKISEIAADGTQSSKQTAIDDDNVGTETPSTDIVGLGNYESDVTTPGLEQTIEVSVESTPENKFNDEEGGETKDEESTEESEFLLSAISERGESALPTSDDLDTEIENRGLGQTDHHEHPGDEDDDDRVEDSGVVFIDNGQTVSTQSATTTSASPSPSAVAQRGSATTVRTPRGESELRNTSASSQKTPIPAERRTSSAASGPASPRASRNSSARESPRSGRFSAASSARDSKSSSASSTKPGPPPVAKDEKQDSKSGTPQTLAGGRTRTVTPADTKPSSTKSPPLPKKRNSVQSENSGSGKSDTSRGAAGTSQPKPRSGESTAGSNKRSPPNRNSRRGSKENLPADTRDGDLSQDVAKQPVGGSSQPPPAITPRASKATSPKGSKSTSPKGSKSTSPKGSKSNSTKTSRTSSLESRGSSSSRPTSAKARTSAGSGIAREGTYVKQADDNRTTPSELIESARIIVEETVERAARSLSASLHSASMSREDSKSLTTSEDVVTVVEAAGRTDSRLSNDTVIIEKGDDLVVAGDRHAVDTIASEDVGIPAANTHPVPRTDEPLERDRTKGDSTSKMIHAKNARNGADGLGEARRERRNAEAPKQTRIAANADSVQSVDETDSTGLRTPDSKTTTLDDSMSLPNDSGHATEEDRGSSPDIRGSDIIAAIASDPHSDSASSKKSTRTVKRAPRTLTSQAPVAVPIPKATTRSTRKSPARSRRNKSPPPPEKYLNRLKRSKSEGVALHKLQTQSGDQTGSRVNSRASEGGEGRLSRLQSKSVAEIEQQRHEEMEKLRAKLDTLRSERQECEVQKEEMVKHVRSLHAKLIQEKEAVHELWRKRYLEEKKLTPKIEEESAKWRLELERIHKDMITKVEGRDPNDAKSPFSRLEEPSNKVSYKIMVARLLQEIEDLKRRLETTKLRLGAEAKLRAMAEKDVRTLREDLIQKKIQVTLTRKETDSVIAPFYRDTIYSLHPLM
ncbi:dentin sialophosphoprotein-like [Galendromus occidentalis]|uniref:Dentin sialophosphoprotein-like n=1 Tax=Galendromus occidentalis TaxID=34638 RepID=A0AAJ7SDZ8_9ACAR|nr:dentin sialophosphoprotein-like [Galendromus occidentalis]